MIRVSLAEWVVSIDAQPAALAEQIAERYGAFACAEGKPAELSVKIHCEGDEESQHTVLQTPLRANGEEYLLDAPAFYGMIAPSRGQAELRMRSSIPAREAEYFLRVALGLFAWQRGGLLVHGAAVLAQRAVYLFIGQSGSGKSTVVSLSRNRGLRAALSDDLVLLRRSTGEHDGSAWLAYGTPFWNLPTAALPPDDRDGQTSSGPLKAIYKLAQDRDVFLEPMSPAAGAAELFANCPIVNGVPEHTHELLLRCREIVGAVGLRKLHFRKDDAFWEIITC